MPCDPKFGSRVPFGSNSDSLICDPLPPLKERAVPTRTILPLGWTRALYGKLLSLVTTAAVPAGVGGTAAGTPAGLNVGSSVPADIKQRSSSARTRGRNVGRYEGLVGMRRALREEKNHIDGAS